MKQVLVIGLGSFGHYLATELSHKKCEVTVIDLDSGPVNEIKDEVSQAIIGDATDKNLLNKFVSSVDVAVVCVGEKMDSSILITHLLKELEVKHIISRAVSEEHGKVLGIVGANEVIFPERDEAENLATRLITPDILEIIRVSKDYDIVEIGVPEELINKSLESLNLGLKSGIQILAINNPLNDEIQILPKSEYVFRPDDILIVIGHIESLKKVRFLGEK